MDTYSLFLVSLLALALSLFVGNSIARYLRRRKVLIEIADYYRGYNTMAEICAKHGIDSQEASYWLFCAESATDDSEFDKGIQAAHKHFSDKRKDWKEIR